MQNWITRTRTTTKDVKDAKDICSKDVQKYMAELQIELATIKELYGIRTVQSELDRTVDICVEPGM